MYDDETLYSVDTGYANAGVAVVEGKVIDAAPIFRWMIGKQWDEVQAWKKIKSIQIASKPRVRRKMSGWLCAECNHLFYENKQAASDCCFDKKA